MRIYSFQLDEDDETLLESIRRTLVTKEHRRISIRDIVIDGLFLLQDSLSGIEKVDLDDEDIKPRRPRRKRDEDGVFIENDDENTP